MLYMSDNEDNNINENRCSTPLLCKLNEDGYKCRYILKLILVILMVILITGAFFVLFK